VRSDQLDLVMKYGVLSGWFMGYYSAVNAYDLNSNGDATGTMKPRDIMIWLFSYCRNNPRGMFVDALNALDKALGRLPRALTQER
jgi:hypothetical protein